MAVLSDDELVGLLLETCYELGVYSMTTNQSQLYDVKAALEARDKMKADLLSRLAGKHDEPQFRATKIKDESEVDARNVLMALIPAIWRATERNNRPSRAAAFALVCRLNQTLRPLGFEYLLRPGNMIVLRRAARRYTWADETR